MNVSKSNHLSFITRSNLSLIVTPCAPVRTGVQMDYTVAARISAAAKMAVALKGVK